MMIYGDRYFIINVDSILTCGSVQRMPSIHSITRTREPESSLYTRGILTVGSSLKFSKKSSMLRASYNHNQKQTPRIA